MKVAENQYSWIDSNQQERNGEKLKLFCEKASLNALPESIKYLILVIYLQ